MRESSNGDSRTVGPRRHSAVICGIALVLAYTVITFFLAAHIAQSPISSDYEGHALFVMWYWEQGSFASFFQHIPYPIWHIVYYCIAGMGVSHFAAIGIATAFFNALTALIVYVICIKEIGSSHIVYAIVATVLLLFVTAIWVPSFNAQIYLGQGSPNIWHNPTYLAVRPFALLATYLFCKCLEKQEMSIGEVTVIAALLVFSAFCKPSFIQVFLPAALVVLIILAWRRERRFAGRVVLMLLPTCLMFLYEYLALSSASSASNTGSWFTLSFFGAWASSSPNVLISALLLLAFPIFFLVLERNRIFSKSIGLGFPTILLVVGLAENSFLAETGERFYYGNFGWGFCLSVFIYWTLILPKFFRKAFIEHEYNVWAVVIGSALLIAHFISGICYCFILATTNAPY